VLLTVAVAACACFVSVINDLTDIAEDAMCGKPNAAAGRPRLGNAALLLACGAAGLAFAGLWWGQPLALVFYFASWVSFSLYSLPPVRLKTRGLAGVFADGCGAHLFPALLGVTLVFGAAGRSPDLFWLLGAAVWSLAYGLRGIIGHQLADDANDARAGVDTYVRRRRREHVLALCSRVLLPLEVGALAVLMASLASPLPILAVVLYALFSLGSPQESRGEAALQSTGVAFYGAVLPLTLLTAAAISRPIDALVA
jgi:4-hydroxybenzoate polyprenyltransferase